MKRDKKIRLISILSVFLLSSKVLFAGTGSSSSNDSILFSEVVSSYSGTAYPAVVEFSEKLERSFPDSVYVAKSQLYKGESLFHLSRFMEAESALIRSSASDDNDIVIQSYYWLGRTRMALGKTEESLSALYKCCEIAKSEKKSRKALNCYRQALFYAGEICFSMENYSNSIPLFEAVVSDGDGYSYEQYGRAFVCLFKCYIEERKYGTLISLYRKISVDGSQQMQKMYYDLSLLAEQAYEISGDIKNAWKCCTVVFESDDSELLSKAFRTAYRISSDYEKASGKKTADIFEKLSNQMSENSQLLAELWVRIATDAYESGNHEESKIYFNRASAYDSEKRYGTLISLYMARLNGDTLKLVGTVDENSDFYIGYEISFAEQYAEIEDWNQCLRHSEKAYESMDTSIHGNNVCRKISYYYGMALLNCGKIYECENIISAGKVGFADGEPYFTDAKKLLARCYCLSGREKKSLEVYSALNEKGLLSGREKNDYAKLLFSCGYLSLGKKLALESNTVEGKYIAGLSSFNLKEWKNAESYFDEYLRSEKSENRSYALFYFGYCKYKNENPEACNVFDRFCREFSSHALCYSASILCANAAMKKLDFETAESRACSASKYARNESDRQNAIMLASTICFDSKKYEKSLALLSPYLSDNTEFGIKCRFQTAVIYSKIGRISDSERLYSEVEEKFPESSHAEESSYRRGELFYAEKDFKNAAIRFSDYIRKYPKGSFSEDAFFYGGDSYRNIPDANKAILSYEMLLAEYPNTLYSFSVLKNLSELYRANGNYPKAREKATTMNSIATSSVQKEDAIRELKILDELMSGKDSAYVALHDAFVSKGELSSEDGRIAGTELAEYLWNCTPEKEKAVELSGKLYRIQTKHRNVVKESVYAARNAIVLALYYKEINDHSKSSSYFLEAAKHARQGGDFSMSARCLYGASEIFASSGKKGDLKATASNLLELYPDSEYSVKVRDLLK